MLQAYHLQSAYSLNKQKHPPLPPRPPLSSPPAAHPCPLLWVLGSHRLNIFKGLQSMTTAPPAKKKKITKHHFVMSGHEGLFYKVETVADFKPLRKNQQGVSRSILPTFVNDRKYYTCAFRIPSDIAESDRLLLEDHLKRMRESYLELEEMYLPKPRSRTKYCGVCRALYEDYKEHIESDSHMNLLKRSPSQMLIHRYCQQFQEEKLRREGEEMKLHELSTCEEAIEKGIENCEFSTASKSVAL